MMNDDELSLNLAEFNLGTARGLLVKQYWEYLNQTFLCPEKGTVDYGDDPVKLYHTANLPGSLADGTKLKVTIYMVIPISSK